MIVNLVRNRSNYIRAVLCLERNFWRGEICVSSLYLFSKKSNLNNIHLYNYRYDFLSKLNYCTNSENEISAFAYEGICKETLESLFDYFEEIVENNSELKGADIIYGDGVLTIYLGEKYGTYVINRQTPNKQIWLSSPISGPKRYDFSSQRNGWIYKHDGISLHQLLQSELNKKLNISVDFSQCSFALV